MCTFANYKMNEYEEKRKSYIICKSKTIRIRIKEFLHKKLKEYMCQENVKNVKLIKTKKVELVLVVTSFQTSSHHSLEVSNSSPTP